MRQWLICSADNTLGYGYYQKKKYFTYITYCWICLYFLVKILLLSGVVNIKRPLLFVVS
jgi:hypothetical protein